MAVVKGWDGGEISGSVCSLRRSGAYYRLLGLAGAALQACRPRSTHARVPASSDSPVWVGQGQGLSSTWRQFAALRVTFEF